VSITSICGVQFDSVRPLGFTPALEARYINGEWASPADYGPGRVYIDVMGGAADRAFWSDVEKGDMTPADVPRQLDQRQAAGLGYGGIYCDRDNLAAVEAAAGTRPHLLWIATLDGTTTGIDPVPGFGVLAVIQIFPAAMLGLPADLSIVVDPAYWRRGLAG
jgi:hypothetical protein